MRREKRECSTLDEAMFPRAHKKEKQMKRLAVAGLILCGLLLLRTAFAYPARNNYVTVFADVDGGGLTEDFSGWVITNTSATGAQTFTLPPAATGLHFIFSLSAAQDIDVNPQNDDQIIGLTNAAGDAISSDALLRTTVELVAVDSTKWLPIRTVGTWSDAN
jgi:hypothetical protein